MLREGHGLDGQARAQGPLAAPLPRRGGEGAGSRRDDAMNERDIFHAAVEIADPGERTDYLEKVCAGNATLKRHVDGMLKMYPQLGSFLESPVGDLDSAATAPVSAGRFQLGEELARGGMGV